MFWGQKKYNTITEKDKIETVLFRGVEEIFPSKEDLRKLLASGKRLSLYQGFDPTGKDLHVGHMIGLRKLAQFQKLGHEVIFLIGDGTGQAGDPGGKAKSRDKFFTNKELRDNAKEYVKQASKIVSFTGNNPAKVRFNGDWLNNLKLPDILNIAENFTLRDFTERSTFKERTKSGQSVNLREFLYPLLQSYDSVILNVDLEIGGTDQTFNMLAGRALSRKMLNKEKFVLTTPLLTDSKGIKIGKSEGNVISLTDEPEDLYGKIMSLSDDVIVDGLKYLSDVSMVRINEIIKELKTQNPKPYKELLALEIVTQLYGKQLAEDAARTFTRIFSEKKKPTDIKIYSLLDNIRETILAAGIVESKTDWNRLVEAGAVTNLDTGKKITDTDSTILKETTFKIGKHRFITIKP